MEGPWQAAAPPSPLHAVPNVTVHPSTASVPITVLLHNGPLLCGFNVKGLMLCLESSSYSFLPCTLRILYLFEQNDSAAVGLILKQFSVLKRNITGYRIRRIDNSISEIKFT